MICPETTDSVTLLTMREINSTKRHGCHYYSDSRSPCGAEATLVVELSYCSLTLEELSDKGPWRHDPHPREDCKEGGTSNPDFTVICESHSQLMRTLWPNVARIHSLAEEAAS